MTPADYTLAEKLFLGNPVAATEGYCDVAGCFEEAVLLVPRAGVL